eukprot:TRINITY_DN18864_c0_g1_i1.p1 TRINITY_DN18864_c0_g1~~TRINITY_DN18864_c0_g1_i1.p1  ORF type:complete len:876 (-),score=150.04 TRINITY_DN18864_c0_g1_i1:305-2542(-)
MSPYGVPGNGDTSSSLRFTPRSQSRDKALDTVALASRSYPSPSGGPQRTDYEDARRSERVGASWLNSSQMDFERIRLSTQQERLMQWLLSIGINMPKPAGPSYTMTDVGEMFRDGVRLCKLIQILDRYCRITGIHEIPKTKAASLANINKALEALRHRPRMPLNNLFSSSEIVEGNASIILSLLEDIRQHFVGKKSTSENRSSSTERGRPNTASPREHNTVQLSPKQELEIRQWLRNLSLQPPYYSRADRNLNTLADPWFNGYNACLLASRLEGIEIPDVHRIPETLILARANWQKAVSQFRRRGLSLHFFDSINEILKGDGQALFALLWESRGLYPLVTSPSVHFQVEAKITPEQLKKIEDEKLQISLVGWLHSIGLLTKPNTSFSTVVQMAKTGVLLCDLVELMDGKKLPGVFRPPKTTATCLSNITKACDALIQKRTMGRRYLNKTRELSEGDEEVVSGLLEDIRRAFDGVPPRSSAPKPGESHYYGNAADTPIPTQAWSPSHRVTAEELAMEYIAGRSVSPQTFNSIKKVIEDSTSRATSHKKLSDAVGIPTPHAPQHEGRDRASSAGVRRQSPSPATRNTSPPQEENRQGMVYDQQHLGVMSIDISIHEKAALLRWLNSHGIKIASVEILEEPFLDDFKDGVLLCRLLEKLELQDIQYTKNPKSAASYLFNINKALEVLRKKRTMPLDYLWSAEEIRDGRAEIILPLLLQVKKVYQTKAVPQSNSGLRRTQSLRSLTPRR